jgi:hypothetical protein
MPLQLMQHFAHQALQIESRAWEQGYVGGIALGRLDTSYTNMLRESYNNHCSLVSNCAAMECYPLTLISHVTNNHTGVEYRGTGSTV